MPNSLVHFALQIPVTRVATSVEMVKWGMLGCIVPDIPWMLQRIVYSLNAGIDPYDLRIYCTVQASLILCLVFSALMASIARVPLQVFVVVGSNSAIHLLLDAFEIKWANGVNLLAPLDWRLWNYGFLWPDHFFIGLLSLIGAGIAVFYTFSIRPTNSGLFLSGLSRIFLALVFLTCYLITPILFLDQAREANVHFVSTLSDDVRNGMLIEIDRTAYLVDDEGARVVTFADEEIGVIGNLPKHDGQISIRGRFVDHGTILVEEFHVGQPMFRDNASILALVFFVVIWLRYLQTELPWRRSSGRDESHEHD